MYNYKINNKYTGMGRAIMKIKSLIASSIILALSACNDSSVSPEAGNSPGSLALTADSYTGNSYVGGELTATISDNNGYASDSVTYQWMSGDDVIISATSNSYVLIDADLGKNITVSATYTDDDDYEESPKSFASDTVELAPVDIAGSVVISGDAYVDSILTATITDLNGSGDTPIIYTWMLDGSAIDGATEATYMLTSAALGSVVTVTVAYTDNDGFTQEEITSHATNAVIVESDAPVTVMTNVASITDNMDDDAGELRYKHGSTIEAGKLTVSFAKDEVLTSDNSTKEAYIALYGSSTSTSAALVDLRIGNGTFTIRDQANIAVVTTFIPGNWLNVEMTWDASNASATVAPLMTISINGSAVTTTAFDSVSSDKAAVMDGVQTVVFKLSDTSSIVTGAYLVDDLTLYSDLAGSIVAFEDDFESYAVGDSLDTDNDASPYNGATAEAFVVVRP